MIGTFDKIDKKDSGRVKYHKKCERCGTRFKTTKYGTICVACQKSLNKKRAVKWKRSRCKKILANGERCKKEVIIAGYCGLHLP